MPRTRRLAVLYFAAALVLAGCSGAPSATTTPQGGASSAPGGAAGSPSGGSPGSVADLCTVLAASEVQAATGLAVTGTDHVGLPPASACRWNLEDGTNSEGVAFHRFVDVDVLPTEAAFDAEASGQPSLQDLGDRAASMEGGVAFVLHGMTVNVAVTLHQTGSEDAATESQEQAMAVQLAKLAVGRL